MIVRLHLLYHIFLIYAIKFGDLQGQRLFFKNQLIQHLSFHCLLKHSVINQSCYQGQLYMNATPENQTGSTVIIHIGVGNLIYFHEHIFQ